MCTCILKWGCPRRKDFFFLHQHPLDFSKSEWNLSAFFFIHSFSHTVLLVNSCHAVLFSQVSGCALFPLKHEVWIPSGNISVGPCNLWFSSFAAPGLCVPVCGRGREESSSAQPPCKEWTRKDAFHLTSVQCKLDGPWRLFYCSASKAWKDISGQSGQGCLWFFSPSVAAILIPTLNCFAFKGTNLTCQDGCSSSFLKDESASTEFPQTHLLLSCVDLKTLTSAAGLIYSTKGGKSVYSCLNSVLKE